MPSKKRSARPQEHSTNIHFKCPNCGGRKDWVARQCWNCYNNSRRSAEHLYDRKGRKHEHCSACGGPKTLGCRHCQKCAFDRTHTKVSSRIFYRKGRPFRWIRLTRGHKVAVDARRYEVLAQSNWFTLRVKKLVYAVRWVRIRDKKTLVFMHHQIMGKIKGYVDHIDHDTLNNMKYNLRWASPLQSVWNRRRTTRNTSGYIGVSWIKARRYWYASIMTNGKRTFLGAHHSKIEAAKAYDAAAEKHRGKFAHLNFPKNLNRYRIRRSLPPKSRHRQHP